MWAQTSNDILRRTSQQSFVQNAKWPGGAWRKNRTKTSRKRGRDVSPPSNLQTIDMPIPPYCGLKTILSINTTSWLSFKLFFLKVNTCVHKLKTETMTRGEIYNNWWLTSPDLPISPIYLAEIVKEVIRSNDKLASLEATLVWNSAQWLADRDEVMSFKSS